MTRPIRGMVPGPRPRFGSWTPVPRPAGTTMPFGRAFGTRATPGAEPSSTPNWTTGDPRQPGVITPPGGSSGGGTIGKAERTEEPRRESPVAVKAGSGGYEVVGLEQWARVYLLLRQEGVITDEVLGPEFPVVDVLLAVRNVYQALRKLYDDGASLSSVVGMVEAVAGVVGAGRAQGGLLGVPPSSGRGASAMSRGGMAVTVPHDALSRMTGRLGDQAMEKLKEQFSEQAKAAWDDLEAAGKLLKKLGEFLAEQ